MKAFSNWRNIQNSPSDPPALKHMERFQVVSRPDSHNKKTPYWLNYPTTHGSFGPVRGSGSYSWKYCPSVHRTYFDTDDGDYVTSVAERYGKLSPVERMKRHNQGTHNGEWQIKRVLHKMDNWYRCDAICSQLELTDAQKARVQVLLNSLNLQREGRSLDQVVYTLSALVCREDGRRTYPSPNSSYWDARFSDIAGQLGFSEKKVRSWMQEYGRKLESRLRPTDQRRKLPHPPKKPEWWSHWGQHDGSVKTAS